MPNDEEIFSRLASEIREATDRQRAGDTLEDDLPTAADMARKFNFKLDKVKKKLQALREAGLIQPISMTPKRYRFNHWALKSLDADHPFHALFCEPESPYFMDLCHQADK